MGCGTTLFRAVSGHIYCTTETCPRPNAVAEILADGETAHIVVVDRDGFTVRHPLRERLDDALLTCDVHASIPRLAGPPHKPGRYRVWRKSEDTWTWENAAEVSGR